MKSITIHNLDDKLDSLIREKAKKQGMSLNKTIKLLLKKSLGLDKNNENDHKNDFMDLFGIWSKKDLNEFNKKIKDLREVNINDWK